MLHAPNGAIFVIAAFLAMVGILAALPVSLSIPGLTGDSAAWFIFLAWFLLAVGTVVPARPVKAPSSASASEAA